MKVPFLKLIVRKIRKSIAIVEEGDTVTHSGGLAVGKYVIWKGTQYKVTTAMSYGETISGSKLSAVSDGIANELNSKITNDFGKVLWTNPSPTSDFADGYLSVPDVNKYRIILIHFLSIKNNPEEYSGTYVAYIGQKGILKYDNLFRLFTTYTDIAQIHFQEGGEGGVGFNNKYIIPLKIIGIL